MNDNTTPVREFVLRRITEGLSLGGHEFSGNAWYLILGVVLTIGFVYVVWMYVRDGHSIGWFWGTFLALLRLTVYAILGAVFLLPAYQNWEETKQQSKVVLAFDFSRSMKTPYGPFTTSSWPTLIPPSSRLENRPPGKTLMMNSRWLLVLGVLAIE